MQSARIIAGLTIAAALAGCATRPHPSAVVVDRPEASAWSAGASALAFTPPVAYAVADELALDRDGRRQVAYAGFESTVIDETWVRQDDRQRFGRWGDQSQFERRAVSTRVTVSGR